jgi:hypothetical protein
MLNRIEPSVNKLIEHVELRTDYHQPVSKGEVHGEAGE